MSSCSTPHTAAAGSLRATSGRSPCLSTSPSNTSAPIRTSWNSVRPTAEQWQTARQRSTPDPLFPVNFSNKKAVPKFHIALRHVEKKRCEQIWMFSNQVTVILYPHIVNQLLQKVRSTWAKLLSKQHHVPDKACEGMTFHRLAADVVLRERQQPFERWILVNVRSPENIVVDLLLVAYQDVVITLVKIRYRSLENHVHAVREDPPPISVKRSFQKNIKTMHVTWIRVKPNRHWLHAIF